MTAYADYEFYKNEYLCGKEAVVDTASFEFYAKKASAEINKYAKQNIDENNVTKCVKTCCCEIAEILHDVEQCAKTSSGKTSESVGGWSVGYESKEQTMTVSQDNIKRSILTWLSGTGLLYGGVKNAYKR